MSNSIFVSSSAHAFPHCGSNEVSLAAGPLGAGSECLTREATLPPFCVNNWALSLGPAWTRGRRSLGEVVGGFLRRPRTAPDKSSDSGILVTSPGNLKCRGPRVYFLLSRKGGLLSPGGEKTDRVK